MKKIFTVLFILISIFSLNAQRSPAPKPATAAPQPAKPKATPNYVKRAEWDSTLQKLNGRIAAAQNSVGNVKGSISSNTAEISTLKGQMKQVEDLLNSANFKISLTSDSLNQTRFSMEEKQKQNEDLFARQSEQIQKLNTMHFVLAGAALLAIILAAAIWFIYKGKIQSLETAHKLEITRLKNENEEARQQTEKELKHLDHQVKTEGRSAQHFAERLNNATKEEVAHLKHENENLVSTIQVITAEIKELHDRLNNLSK